jgi:hypothetical protein
MTRGRRPRRTGDGFGFRRKRRSLRYDRGDTSMRCDHENRQGKDDEGGGAVKQEGKESSVLIVPFSL